MLCKFCLEYVNPFIQVLPEYVNIVMQVFLEYVNQVIQALPEYVNHFMQIFLEYVNYVMQVFWSMSTMLRMDVCSKVAMLCMSMYVSHFMNEYAYSMSALSVC